MTEHNLTQTQIIAYGRRLEEEERAPATREKYLRSTRSFFRWLRGRPVTKERVIRWREHLLTEEGLAPSTVNGNLSAVNGLFAFLGWEGCRAKFLKLQRRLFRDPARELTKPEYERLVSTAGKLGRARLALMIETICSTGIRASELRFVTVEAARAGRTVIRLKGKIRDIILSGKLCRKLLKYARKNKIASGALFRTGSGKSINRRQIWAEMKGLCPWAKVNPAKVFPHNLRHLFAATYYQVYRDIAKLADVLGHSSIETTRIYLLTSGTEHQRQLDSLGLVT